MRTSKWLHIIIEGARQVWCLWWLHCHAIKQLRWWSPAHDDVIKWKHFPRYWPFVRGIHRSPVNSPHKSQWRGALMFSLICAWINGWANTRGAGDLRRYLAHYDVIVMHFQQYGNGQTEIWMSASNDTSIHYEEIPWKSNQFSSFQIGWLYANTDESAVYFVFGIRWRIRITNEGTSFNRNTMHSIGCEDYIQQLFNFLQKYLDDSLWYTERTRMLMDGVRWLNLYNWYCQ